MVPKSRGRLSPCGIYHGVGNHDQVLVAGPGAKLDKSVIERFLKSGGNLLAIGLDEREANSFLPFKVSMKKAEHIATGPTGTCGMPGSHDAGILPLDFC